MADRDVTIRVNVQGAEQAARSMENLAQKTQQAANAAESLEGGRRGLFSQNPGGISDAEMRARQGRFLERFGVRSSGDEISDEAQRRLDRQIRNEKIERQMKVLQGIDPDAPDPPGGGGLSGRAGASIGRRWQSQLLTTVGLAAGANAFEGMGRGLQELAADTKGAADAFAVLSMEMTKSIPIIGDLARGLASTIDAISGRASSRAALAEFLPAAGRQLDFAGFAQGQGLLTSRQIADQRLRGRSAAIEAGGAAAFAAGLTPDVLASFRPRGIGGDVDSHLGGLIMSARQASSAADVAERLAAEQRASVLASRAGLDQLRGREAEIRQEIAAAERRAFQLERPGLNRLGNTRAVGPGGVAPLGVRAADPEAAAEMRARAGILGGELTSNLSAQTATQQEILDRQAAAERAQTNAVKERTDAKRKELEIDRARLQVQDQEISRVRGGVTSAGFRSRAENQADLELARLARSSPESLTPEMWARLTGNPIFSQFAQQQGRSLAEQDPSVQAGVREFGGLGGRTLAEAEAAQDKAFAEMEKRLASVTAEGAEKTAGIVTDSVEKFFKTLTDLLEAKLAEFAANANRKNLLDQAQRGGS